MHPQEQVLDDIELGEEQKERSKAGALNGHSDSHKKSGVVESI